MPNQDAQEHYGDGWEDGTNTLLRRLASDDVIDAVAAALYARQPHNLTYDWRGEAEEVVAAAISALARKGTND